MLPLWYLLFIFCNIGSNHRNILCAAEGSRDEYPFENANGTTLKAIVDFCYTGRIDLTEENVRTFLVVAPGVALDPLKHKCRQFYGEKLNINTAIEAFMIADKYSYADLRQSAFNFVCANFEKISTAENRKLDHLLLREVLECKHLNSFQAWIFKVLLEWPVFNADKRKQHMPEFLQLIQLGHLSLEVSIPLNMIFR